MKERPPFPARLDFSAGAPTGKRSATASIIGAGGRVDKLPGKVLTHGAAMDSRAVRMSMVQMLARQGIADPAVLSAMGAIERHRFVDSALFNQA